MSDTETIPASAASALLEDESDTLLKPQPSFIVLMVSVAAECKEESPEVSIERILYQTVTEFLKNPAYRPDAASMFDTIFIYYLECHRSYQIYEQTATRDDQKAYTRAALSLFDLYLETPKDFRLRSLIPITCAALHKLLATQQSIVTERSMRDILSELSTLVMLTDTVKDYVRKKTHARNLAYIRWLRDFLTKATQTLDLSFLKNDPILTAVMTQVSHSYPIITIPS